MNISLSNTKSMLIALLAFSGVALCGSLGISQSVSASELAKSSEKSSILVQNTNENGQNIFAAEQAKPSYIVSVAQDELISNALLIFLYLALPASFGLLIWQHDKRHKEQLAKLIEQIATLERIWHQDPQH
ncbi:hypothetical protein HCU40_22800 (plasmid) [Pseudanabaena biceps]|nr:hypothetical protein [Pseudanabaena biceps]